MKKIKLHNRENGLGKHGFTMEMNAFGDMVTVTYTASRCVFFFNSLMFLLFNNLCIISLKTVEEFRKLMIEIPIATVKKENSVQKREAVNVPNFINWRKRGYVTPVRRQVLLCHMPTFLSHRKLGRGMSAWIEQFL